MIWGRSGCWVRKGGQSRWGVGGWQLTWCLLVCVVCCVLCMLVSPWILFQPGGTLWHDRVLLTRGWISMQLPHWNRYNNERKTFAIMGLTKIDLENHLGDVRPFFGLFWGLIWTVLNGQDYIFSRKRHRPNKSVELFSQKWIICKYFSSPPPRAVSVPSHVQWVYKFKEPFEPYIETCNSF